MNRLNKLSDLVLRTVSREDRQYLREMASSFIRNGNYDFEGFNDYYSMLAQVEGVRVIDNKGNEIPLKYVINEPRAVYFKKVFFEEFNKFQNRKGVDHRGPFIKVYRNFQTKFEGRLSNGQRSKLLELMQCVQYGDQLLAWKGKEMTAESIAEFWGISKTTALNKYLTFFCKKDTETGIHILCKKRIGNKYYYHFNPECLFKGESKNNEYSVKLYTNKLKEIIKEIKKIEHERKQNKGFKRGEEHRTSALGVLHAITPYFHFQTYYLVKNPLDPITNTGESVLDGLERDQQLKRRKHIHLPKIQLAKIVASRRETSSMQTSKMRQDIIMMHLDTLRDAGALVYKETKGKLTIRIHPYLLFSTIGDGKDEFTKKVLIDDFGEAQIKN